MQYNPEPYQREGTRQLLECPLFGLLFDPGLGKTATVLHALKAFSLARPWFSALIIAPRLVCLDVWPSEIEKWNQFRSLTYSQLRSEPYQPGKDIYLINPELPRLVKVFGQVVKNLAGVDFDHWLSSSHHQKKFRSLMAKHPRLWPWDWLIVDESSKFKNPSSKRFKVLRKFIPYFKRRTILTGTFAPNSLLDVFSQMLILDHGKTFGEGITAFREKYFTIDNPKFYTYKIRGKKEVKEIQDKIAPWVMRLDASKHLDLPELIHNRIEITLPKSKQKHYNQIEQELFTQFDTGEKLLVPNSSNNYHICRQLACGSYYDPQDIDRKKITVNHFHSLKTERLRDLIDELNGKPLLIAFVYRSDAIQIQKDLKKKLPIIDGRCSAKIAKGYIGQWNARKIPVLLVQSASIAHGVNLQSGGNDLCFYNLTDNLEDYEQLIRRIYRKGVKGQVRIHYLICKNTIDVVNYRRIQVKGKNQKNLLTALERYWNDKRLLLPN